jgi:hypothetical protein
MGPIAAGGGRRINGVTEFAQGFGTWMLQSKKGVVAHSIALF